MTNHVAHHPKHLNIRVLPDAMKSEIVNRFEELMFWAVGEDLTDNTFKKLNEIRTSTIKYMTSESYYDTHWNEFLSYKKNLDKIRSV